MNQAMCAAGPVRLEREGAIALVVTDAPPVNVLGLAVRSALIDAVSVAAASDAAAIVMLCEGRTFFSGADIAELHAPVAQPDLLVLEEACRTAPQPVIIAMHGHVLGGGMVIGYCGDYRIALPQTRFGMPEVKLGLLATFGGTQFLPRLIGMDHAVPMLLGAEPVDAAQALGVGFLDRIVEAPLRDAALSFSATVIAERRAKRPVRAMPLAGDAADHLACLAAAERDLRAASPDWRAPLATLQAIEDGVRHGIERGLATEARAFEELRTSRQARVLQRLFFARRALIRAGLGRDVRERLRAAAGGDYDPARAPAQRAALAEAADALLAEGKLPDRAVADAAIADAVGWPAWHADIMLSDHDAAVAE